MSSKLKSQVSLQSEFKRAHDYKCLCQICICNNPNHKCPIGKHNTQYEMKTTNQKDFVPHQVEKPDLWMARDNLKFKKLQNPDTTEYRAEYVKKQINLPE